MRRSVLCCLTTRWINYLQSLSVNCDCLLLLYEQSVAGSIISKCFNAMEKNNLIIIV